MPRGKRVDGVLLLGVLVVAALLATAPARAADAAGPRGTPDDDDLATGLLEAAGVSGGLIVHLGCGDGRLTASLGSGPGRLVHGLDVDPQSVRAARERIRSVGRYGAVSVDRLVGPRLPYIDNLVNLVVAQELGEVAPDELTRVLAPNGVALVAVKGEPAAAIQGEKVEIAGTTWTRIVKPRPAEIDDWTHYLHDAGGNAVSQDEVVGPPRHLQWVGSPRWARHHDHMSSFNAMVSAGGRLFYVFDEGPTSAIQLPPRWSLVARDAFNGCILWKRRIDPWQIHLWNLKSGPAQLPRRLVAVDDTVYVPLGLDKPLSALDAATGRTLRTFPETEATEEVVFSEGVLFVVVNDEPTARPWSTVPRYETIAQVRAESERWAWDAPPRSLVALEAQTGKVLWKARTPVAPLTLAADGARVLLHDGDRVVCLDRTNGQRQWSSQPIARAEPMRSWFAPTLVVQDDVVLFAGGEKIVRHRGGQDSMTALDARTGEVLWTAEHPPSGYDSPEDVLVVDGLVWTAPMTNRRDTGEFTGRNLRTGEVERKFPADDGDHMPHHRCHRARATVNYILASRTGIEYVDLEAEHWNRNDWVRGACLYGIMPANGLTYAPHHSCACYIVAKLNGLIALAPARTAGESDEAEPKRARLERGPAYDALAASNSPTPSSQLPSPSSRLPSPDSPLPTPSAWPTYRHDAARSGRSAQALPEEMKQSWATTLGGRLSAPVVAEGKLFVAEIDAHTVHALDAASGKPAWSFTAGGRVDSPPTIWRGRVLFGSADGWVYCLRAADGALAWRFRAAPEEQRVVAWEQVESAWPLHGNVLVLDGEQGRDSGGDATVYCVAGRSMFLDGGMRLVRLDAATGRLVSETTLTHLHPETGEPLDADVTWPNLPVALPDVLSYDGKYVYMRSQRFDREGERIDVAPPTDYRDQTGDGAHLFCPTGFLDDAWWHRTYYLWGKNPISAAGGWFAAAYHAPAGRLLVCDDERVYGFGRKPKHFPSTTALEYHLFGVPKEPELVTTGKPRRRWLPAPGHPVYDWSEEVPLLGRALVMAGDRLFVAGPPDVVDTEQTQLRVDAPETRARLAAQAAALEGTSGALLWDVSVKDGRKLAEYELETPLVFDGMAAAGGRLYVATVDGRVECLGEAP